MTNFDGWHPLSKRHFLQIARRTPAIRRQMHSIWGIAWRPGDRHGNFLGRMYRSLGSATLMCQVSYQQDDGREVVRLLGIAPRITPGTAAVAYDQVRLEHDFHRVPFPGARGRILDSREPWEEGRGNASWVRLGLDIDRLRERACANHYALPATPRLPAILLGYGSKESAKIVDSAELRRRAAEQLDVPWAGNTLHDLVSRKPEMAAARMQAFGELPEETQKKLMHAAWDSSLVTPDEPENNTGLWLLPQELAEDVYGVVRVFEYFGDLVGAHVFNPARRMTGKAADNPAIDLATTSGFDLLADLQALAHTAEGSPEFQSIEQRLIELVPIVRKSAGVSHLISDQDILNAICQPDLPLVIEPLLVGLPEQQQIEVFRSALATEINEASLDCDILEAIRNPHSPLYAAGLGQVQILHRNTSVPLSEALYFSASSLGRNRVEARFWPESPFRKQPRPRCSTPESALAA